MVTAYSITDEQIRELARSTGIDEDIGDYAHIPELAMAALSPVLSARRGKARARCAEIINARQNGGRP